jgi:hypothetical protein
MSRQWSPPGGLQGCRLNPALNRASSTIACVVFQERPSKQTAELLFREARVPDHALGLERITVNPNQCVGRPCVRGMPIRVKDVLDICSD